MNTLSITPTNVFDLDYRQLDDAAVLTVEGGAWSAAQEVRLGRLISSAGSVHVDSPALRQRLIAGGVLSEDGAPLARHSCIGASPAWTHEEAELRLSRWIDKVPSGWDEYVEGHKKRFAATYRRVPPAPPRGRAIEISAFPLSIAMLKELGYWTAATLFTEHGEPERGEPEGFWKDFDLDCQVKFDIERHRLPFEDATFDLVMAPEIIEHLPTDPQQLLVESNRVLKYDGLLFVTTPNLTSARSLIKGFRHEHPFNHPLFQPDGSMDRHHIEYSLSMLVPMMRSAGFEVVLAETESVWSGYEWDMMRILEQNGYATSDRGDNIFLMGRKVSPLVDRLPPAAYMSDSRWELSFKNQPIR